jgi:coenzyme PQQ precursor peptide PqqA
MGAEVKHGFHEMPAVREQEVGLEVTSYLPAEIDVI